MFACWNVERICMLWYCRGSLYLYVWKIHWALSLKPIQDSNKWIWIWILCSVYEIHMHYINYSHAQSITCTHVHKDKSHTVTNYSLVMYPVLSLSKSLKNSVVLTLFASAARRTQSSTYSGTAWTTTAYVCVWMCDRVGQCLEPVGTYQCSISQCRP